MQRREMTNDLEIPLNKHDRYYDVAEATGCWDYHAFRTSGNCSHRLSDSLSSIRKDRKLLGSHNVGGNRHSAVPRKTLSQPNARRRQRFKLAQLGSIAGYREDFVDMDCESRKQT
jgi:hypothetical protein